MPEAMRPTDIESALADEARRQGTTPELLALDCLRQRFVLAPADSRPEGDQESLADFLADHIGVLNSAEQIPGGAQMSEDTGKKFAAGMLRKRQQGRL